MHTFKTEFTDYDLYQEFTENWDVDFRMLSNSSFYVYLNMFLGDAIQLSRTSLNGKVDQYGLSPKGFRSIVVPACKKGHFIWLGKKVTNQNLLIFPKDRTLDAISFDEFEIFIVDIKEDFLLRTLENFKYKNALKLFNGQEQYLQLDQQFLRNFHHLAENFLQQALIQQSRNIISENLQYYLTEAIVFPLLKYINNNPQKDAEPKARKRDVAIKKAVEIINSYPQKTPTISQLCELTSVSERTLEYAFLEKYQVSPSEYIKATKLHKIRNELIATREQNTKIYTIANKYGFGHMSQFAADFKNQFGCLPSQIQSS
ncbi:AraC family transcriptional regulator [Algibacter mikhailovii]|uniref:AraC family transcriptional regulator n=1 Tax=Algibacter mikhailovii TaxID=425498 RepID=UPI0024951993|nr:helix-turn-helix domain-containing protein [Algibacter mikhailovii]